MIPEEKAYITWKRLFKDSVLAENALGREKVLRVYQEDLEGDPRQTLEQCLKFINEDFHEDCLLPIMERINSSGYQNEDNYTIEFNIQL